MTPFGRALQRSRKVRGWSQERLAVHLKISQATVSFWESGVEYPSFEHLAQLVALLPELLPFAHEEELELLRRLMQAERAAFGGGCACQGCGCGG
ncbi:MAG: helix-turn-helix domain-containing protein [Deinococcota bacterium]